MQEVPSLSIEFPASTVGYGQLLAWLRRFGQVIKVGVEGTDGAGLARHLTAQGVAVVEVERPERRARRAKGKSGPLGALAAARGALSGQANGTPKTRKGRQGNDRRADSDANR